MPKGWSAAQSRFGLRMIGVFAVSTLLPIVFFAAFAHQQTRVQLEANAAAALRREAKDASMRLIERFTAAGAALARAAAEGGEPGESLESYFDSVARRSLEGLDLTPREQAALAAASPVLIETGDLASAPFEILVPAGPGEVWVGTLGRGGLQSDSLQQSQRYWIANGAGELLYAVDQDGLTDSALVAGGAAAPRAAIEIETPDGPEIAVVWPVFLRGHFDHDGLQIGISTPIGSVLEPLAAFERAFVFAILLGLLTSVAIGLHQVRRRVLPLDELIRIVRAVEGGDYEARATIRSGDELDDLGKAFNAMTEEISSYVGSLRKLARASGDLLQEPSVPVVAELLARQSVELTGAALAVVLRQPEIEQDSGGACVVLAAARAERASVAPDALVDITLPIQNPTSGAPILLQRDTHAAELGATWDVIERLLARRVEGLFVVPLRAGKGPINSQLVLATFETGTASTSTGSTFHTVRILADQAAVAFRIAELVGNLRALFEGVIHLTVQAIDEKSPYTGDHCRRVPVLTELIADAVERSSDAFRIDTKLSPEERYELRIAALLHDCGKVATPVHVMDKATKLETIMDRIELVRARAEILRRDLELVMLRDVAMRAGVAETIDWRSLQDAWARIDEDLNLIEKSNVGAEFMSAEAKARVDEIAARHVWVDRAGAPRALLDERDRENLKISRGTLNPEERAVIEGHVSTTIRLLERLPFPREMAAVPYIAGAHHEHLDGSGYPKGLRHDQLNLQTRILGLADLFEALTAKDRPYKPGRNLSETIRILRAMVKDGHIDGDLLEIMLGEKVHLLYAAEYMAVDQIDEAHREELESLTAPWGPLDRLRPRGGSRSDGEPNHC